jgi:hypothetical protein
MGAEILVQIVDPGDQMVLTFPTGARPVSFGIGTGGRAGLWPVCETMVQSRVQ